MAEHPAPQDLLKAVQQKTYKYLIFDLDETLTRLDLPWGEWIEKIIGILPEDLHKEFKASLAGEVGLWGAVVNKQIAVDQQFYQNYLTISREFEEKYFAHTPFQELVDELPALQAMGCELNLWTSNVRSTAEKALLELGVRHLFTTIIAKEDVVLSKPDLDGWKFLYHEGTPLNEYLFIGDSPNDEVAAKAAGIDYFHIDYFK